jgi:hypothetical protein
LTPSTFARRSFSKVHDKIKVVLTAFGAIVGYMAVVMPGYLLDFGVPYDLNGDPVGPMQPVERLQEAVLIKPVQRLGARQCQLGGNRRRWTH